MKLIILILSLFLIGCSDRKGKSIPVTDTKEETVQTEKAELNSDVALQFINNYTRNSNREKNALTTIEFVNKSPLVTTSFKHELSNLIESAIIEDPESGLGFNPIVNAQDYDEDGFIIKTFDSSTGYLTAHGKVWKSFEVTMKVIQQGDEILVDGCGAINIPVEFQAKK